MEEVKYHLKTQLGVTDEFYQHCTVTPIYDTGQGSGNSPTIWLAVSSILLKCYSQRAQGARIESPDRSICMDLYRVGFIDDTCRYVNQFSLDVPPTPSQLLDFLSTDTQLWSDLLWTLGGSLEILKCTDHLSYYKFATDGKPHPQCGQVGPPVRVRTGDGSQVHIPSHSVYKAHKMLGCYKSPSGAQLAQLQVLNKKSDRHT